MYLISPAADLLILADLSRVVLLIPRSVTISAVSERGPFVSFRVRQQAYDRRVESQKLC